MNDDELGRHLRDRVGPQGADYWDRIDAALAGSADDSGEPASDSRDTTAPVIRLRDMNDQISNNRKRSVWLGVAAAAIVVVIAAAALGVGRGDNRPIDVADTTPTSLTTVPSEVDSPTTLPAAAGAPLLVGVDYVRIGTVDTNDADDPDRNTLALLDGDRNTIVELGEVTLGGRHVHRSTDGTLYYNTADGIFALARGASEPEVISTEEALGLGRDSGGQVLAQRPEGNVGLVNGEVTPYDDADPERITAANGLSVEVIPGEFETGDEGFVSHVNRGDAVRLLDERGEQTAIFDLGGPSHAFVSLVDFDGRFIIAARGPEEPALPMWDHFVIDLRVGGGEPVAFAATPGTVSLATTDNPDLPSSMSLPNINLCATWAPDRIKAPPAELPAEADNAFENLTLALARCDNNYLRQVGYAIPWSADGAWTALQSALLGPATPTGNGWTWSAPGVSVAIGDSGTTTVAAAENESATVSIIADDSTMVMTGSVGPVTAERLKEAAGAHGGFRNRDVTTILQDTGNELDEALLQGLEEFLGTSVGVGGASVTAFEAALDGREFRVWVLVDDDRDYVLGELARPLFEEAGVTVTEAVDSGEVTEEERAVFNDLRSLASGDNSAIERLPLAGEVKLAAGPVVAAVRSPDELRFSFEWSLDVGPFRGGDQPVSALDALARGDWNEPIVGPHPHCASPPVPAGVELGGFRRVSIQRVDADLGCLAFETVDVFFNSDGEIEGISYDRWEP